MSAVLASVTVGVFFAVGIFLLLSTDVKLITLGFLSLCNGANLAIITSSLNIESVASPIIGKVTLDRMADPLPQAFILTALVIGMGASVFLAVFCMRNHEETEK